MKVKKERKKGRKEERKKENQGSWTKPCLERKKKKKPKASIQAIEELFYKYRIVWGESYKMM